MGGNESIGPDEKLLFQPSSDEASTPRPPATQAHHNEVVLDMGEASREQGFRLNGCR